MKLAQFAQSVQTIGKTNTILAQGEPGIGKSSILKVLRKQMPEYEVAYIDCAQLDLGDFALPYTENTEAGMKVTHFAPSARFKAHTGKPVVVMLDELGKAQRPVQNVLLTLMLEHRIGDVSLPENSIVFATTNLASDGVGDRIEAHARNRMVVIKIDKPTKDEWCEWGLFAGIDPIVLSFVEAFPQVLASYTNLAEKDVNPYIFDPRKQQVAFVTPRSLEAASNIVKQRDALGTETVYELLVGAVGASAAADMVTYITMGDQMPSWDSIISNPEKAPVPDNSVTRVMTANQAVQIFATDGEESKKTHEMNQWVKYMQRLDLEIQAMFALSLGKNPSVVAKKWVGGNKDFLAVLVKNKWVLEK